MNLFIRLALQCINCPYFSCHKFLFFFFFTFPFGFSIDQTNKCCQEHVFVWTRQFCLFLGYICGTAVLYPPIDEMLIFFWLLNLMIMMSNSWMLLWACFTWMYLSCCLFQSWCWNYPFKLDWKYFMVVYSKTCSLFSLYFCFFFCHASTVRSEYFQDTGIFIEILSWKIFLPLTGSFFE